MAKEIGVEVGCFRQEATRLFSVSCIFLAVQGKGGRNGKVCFNIAGMMKKRKEERGAK